MLKEYVDLGEAINALDFDTVFRIVDGAPVRVDGLYAPEVYHDDANDVEICGAGWRCLTGMTGQYSYSGAVMHPSEFIGAGIAHHLAELAAESNVVFAIVTVSDPEPDDEEDDLIGWAIAYRAA